MPSSNGVSKSRAISSRRDHPPRSLTYFRAGSPLRVVETRLSREIRVGSPRGRPSLETGTMQISLCSVSPFSDHWLKASIVPSGDQVGL